MKYTFSLIILLFLVASFSTLSLADNIQEGTSYQEIVPAQPALGTSGKIEVIEFFWYGCPHCHRFEPTIERWLEDKAEYIEFVRLPAVLRPEWGIHARAFYAAEALGVIEKIHKPFFTAIHRHKRKLDTEDLLAAFFAEHGVSEKDFKKAFKSFGVEAKVRNAAEMGRRYGLTGTPAVIVNGKYRTGGSICNCSFSEVMDIVDSLAEKEQHLVVSSSES